MDVYNKDYNTDLYEPLEFINKRAMISPVNVYTQAGVGLMRDI